MFDWKGDGERKVVRPNCFLFDPPKFNFHKIERKWKRKRGRCVLDKITILHPLANFLSFCFSSLSFPFFFFFFLVDKISSCLHFAPYVHIGSFCLFLSVYLFIYSFGICLFYKLKKKILKCPYKCFLIINMLLFVYIFSKDIMVNLY